MALSLSSSAFQNGGSIPAEFTCDGLNVSPPLSIKNVPPGTVSLALIMTDPDIPKEVHPEGGEWDHWVAFNINPSTSELEAGAAPGIPGKNSRGAVEYRGPCPPPQYEPREHRYFFRLYALDATLGLPEGATKGEVLAAMDGHVIETAELMGRYARV